MTRTLQGVLAATALGGLLALGGGASAQEAGHGKSARGSGNGRMVNRNGFMAPTDEKAVLDRLHAFNEYVLQLSRLAKASAQHPEVKAHALAMLDAHNLAQEQLVVFAHEKAMKLSGKPKPMNRAEKDVMEAREATLDKLRGLMGAHFDSVYMASQVAEHDEAIGMLLAAQQAFPQGALATLLQQQTQQLSQHREQAWRVLGQLNPAGAPGVGGAGNGKQRDGSGR